MLSSFEKCDPEGHQKNFWEPRVDLQTGKMANKRSVAPISTAQSSNSMQQKRGFTTVLLLINSTAATKRVCWTQLKICSWFRCVKGTWTNSENGTLSGSGVYLEIGSFELLLGIWSWTLMLKSTFFSITLSLCLYVWVLILYSPCTKYKNYLSLSSCREGYAKKFTCLLAIGSEGVIKERLSIGLDSPGLWFSGLSLCPIQLQVLSGTDLLARAPSRTCLWPVWASPLPPKHNLWKQQQHHLLPMCAVVLSKPTAISWECRAKC